MLPNRTRMIDIFAKLRRGQCNLSLYYTLNEFFTNKTI